MRLARPRGVDEHPAAAVLLAGRRWWPAPGRGARCGRPAHGWRPRRPRTAIPCTGTTTCSPFEPLVFTAPARPGVVERLPDQPRGADHDGEVGALGRVEVEHQAGRLASRRRGRTGTWNSTARWLASHSSVRRSSQSTWWISRCEPSDHIGDGAHPVRGALGHVALHERRLPGPHPLHRQRPAGEQRDDPVGDRVEVVDEVALGDLEPVTQRRVQAGQPDAVALLLGHRGSPCRLGRQAATGARRPGSAWGPAQRRREPGPGRSVTGCTLRSRRSRRRDELGLGEDCARGEQLADLVDPGRDVGEQQPADPGRRARARRPRARSGAARRAGPGPAGAPPRPAARRRRGRARRPARRGRCRRCRPATGRRRSAGSA